MPIREYFTVDRSPQEVRNLWDWCEKECKGKIEHENPYAMGVAACLMYLMGETEARPQDYKGLFNLKNVLRQPENAEKIGGMGDACFDKLAHNSADTLLPGNPKTLFYGAPFLTGNAASCESLINDGDYAVRSDSDDGRGQG